MRSGYLGLVVATLAWAMPMSARAQRVLEMPARTAAGADALARGPIAVFWNPGSADAPLERGEVLVMDVRGPSSTGLDGTVLAGVVRLDPRTWLLLGYQNLRIDDIERTTTSPLPEDGASPLDIGENVFAVGAVRAMGSYLSIGAGVQYVRGADIIGGDNAVEIGAGVTARPAHSLQPRLGLSVRSTEDGAFWAAGVEVMPEVLRRGEWSLGGSYGAAGSPQYHGLSHRLAASAAWRDVVELSVGVAGEPGLGGPTWDPVAGIGVRFHRFTIGVLRENLPNEVGAVHAFRLSTAF